MCWRELLSSAVLQSGESSGWEKKEQLSHPPTPPTICRWPLRSTEPNLHSFSCALFGTSLPPSLITSRVASEPSYPTAARCYIFTSTSSRWDCFSTRWCQFLRQPAVYYCAKPISLTCLISRPSAGSLHQPPPHPKFIHPPLPSEANFRFFTYVMPKQLSLNNNNNERAENQIQQILSRFKAHSQSTVCIQYLQMRLTSTTRIRFSSVCLCYCTTPNRTQSGFLTAGRTEKDMKRVKSS